MKIKFKTKVRFYTFVALLSASILTIVYLSILRTDNSTTVDKYYAQNAELIVEQLKLTSWGKTSRGEKVLSAFKTDEIRIVTPSVIEVNGKNYYRYNDEVVTSASSGAMIKEQGLFTIYIGIYHISEVGDGNTRLLRYMDYAIPEDEFIHVLVDELLSRHRGGSYFIDGEASREEELDAWSAAEEAVKSYYNDPNYSVGGLSQTLPHYGPSSDRYKVVK